MMLFNLLNKNKKKAKNFLDYSAREQKKLVASAVRGANEMQLALVRDYEKQVKNRRK